MPTANKAKRPPAPPDPAARAFAQEFRLRLKEMREEAGLTQEALCELVGIPLNNYKQMEGSRASKFPPHKLERLSWAVRKSCHYILTGREWRGAANTQDARAA